MAHDESGFKALLKPIQDITRNNWDVDLCRHLEEYLLHISEAVGQSLASMNFAEAAYLLQNSANIYSKKVDRLWTFVLQLLDALGKSKQGKGEGEGGENGDEVEGREPQSKKKRTTPAPLSTDDLIFIEAICSKQCLDLKPKTNPTDPDKKSKIVLNAATKGKPKDGVACWIFDESNEVIGKKEEFRLHWRVLSSGILQEEFTNEHKRSRRREINDDDDYDDGGNSFVPFDEPPRDDESVHPEHEQLDNVNPVDDVPLIPNDSDFLKDKEDVYAAGQQRMEKDNIVHLADVKKKAWEPSLFDQNMPEKPLRKRKVLKQPGAVDENNDKKGKRKRKICDLDMEANSYLVIDWMIEQYVKSSKVDGEVHDYEFLTVFKAERQLKRQIQLRRRRIYNDLVVNQAARKQCGDFEGFEEMDPESDDDGGGFQGFIEDHYDDGVEDVPLPDIRMEDNARLQEGSYENEAVKTMQAYQQRDLEFETNESASLAERVSLWHQLIRPKLEIAETRSAFRIHDYGTRILDHIPGDEGTVVEFSSVVAGLPREEVARTFLATLCLTNTENLELIKTDSREMAMDCIQLKLLSRTRHHEEMHEKMIESQARE